MLSRLIVAWQTGSIMKEDGEAELAPGAPTPNAASVHACACTQAKNCRRCWMRCVPRCPCWRRARKRQKLHAPNWQSTCTLCSSSSRGRRWHSRRCWRAWRSGWRRWRRATGARTCTHWSGGACGACVGICRCIWACSWACACHALQQLA